MAKKTDSVFKMYLAALDMEEKGESFYEKTAKASKTELGKKLFKMLAEDELVHMARVKVIYGALKKGEEWGLKWKKLKIKHPDIKDVFKKLAAKNKDKTRSKATDLDAIEVGLDLEQRSIDFYRDNLAKSRDDLEKQFLDQMIVEEKTHHFLLADMKFYLTAPDAWYIEHEKHSLDGG
jgi:rubrerythrin